MKLISKILIYFSLIFVGIYLYNHQNIEIPNIKSLPFFVLSIIFLVFGFLLQAKVWQSLLIMKAKCKNCDFRFAFISEYLSIFNKYIPGKIWTIIGPSAYVSNNTAIPLRQTTYIATFFQILIIWSGIVISFVGLKPFLNFYEYGLLIFFTIVITIAIFNKQLFGYLSILLKKILKLDLEYFAPKYYVSSILYLFLQWIVWGIGFIFLIKAFYTIHFAFDLLIIFPVAGTLGLLAVIAPGGLGVREGVIIVLLMQYGLKVEEATIISILSRIWFLIGEICIFMTVLYLKKDNFGEKD